MSLSPSHTMAECLTRLQDSLVFVDSSSAVILAAVQDNANHPTNTSRSHSSVDTTDVGLRYLIESLKVRNILDLTAAYALTQTHASKNLPSQRDEDDGVGEEEHQFEPNHVTSTNESSSSLDESGWNNDLDFVDEDATTTNEDEAEESKKNEKNSPKPSVESDGAQTDVNTHLSSLPVDFLSLSTSHADVNEPDVIALTGIEDVQSNASTATRSTNVRETPKTKSEKSKKGTKASKKPKDEWGWDDEEEVDEEEESEEDEEGSDDANPPSSLPLPLPRLPSTQPPSTLPPPPSKACFVLSDYPSSGLIDQIASIIVRGRGGAMRYTNSKQKSAISRRLTSITLLLRRAPIDDMDGVYDNIRNKLSKRLKELMKDDEDGDAHFTLQVSYFPLSHIDLSAPLLSTATASSSSASSSIFLTPVTSSSNLVTYPPALHTSAAIMTFGGSDATSTKAKKTKGGNSLATPSSTSGSSDSASAASSTSFFSISSLAKGLSEHIREAEQIAMAGHVDGGDDGTDGIDHAQTTGSEESVETSVTSALVDTLHSMRLRPDIFAVGHRTKAIGKKIIQQLQDRKKQSVTQQQQSKPSSTNAKHNNRSSSSSSVPSSISPSPSSPSTWQSASLLLIDRSLDLASVARHHPSANGGVRDRLNDMESFPRLPASSVIGSDSKRTIEDVTRQLLGEDWNNQAEVSNGASKSSHLTSSSDPALLREELFGQSPSSSSLNSASSASARQRMLFPSATSLSPDALKLLNHIQRMSGDPSVASSSAAASASSSSKAALTHLIQHLLALATHSGVELVDLPPAPSSNTSATSLTQLVAHARLILSQLQEHADLRLCHRDVFDIAERLLRSYESSSPSTKSSTKSSTTKSVYDRLIHTEQLLTMQYIANVSSLASGAIEHSTNPNDDANTVALQGLVPIVVEFVQTVREERAMTANQQSGLPLVDTLRLLIFLYSLIGGRHLVPDTETKTLKSMVTEELATASTQDRAWLEEILMSPNNTSVSQSQLTSSAFQRSLVDSFFRQLQFVSLARSDLTAVDWIDLTAPLEGVPSSNPTFQPLATRVLQRIQQPECLLDDLDHIEFGDEDESKKEDASGNDSTSEKDSMSSSIDGVTDSASSSASNSVSSGWSLFGSIASVVSSVTKSTPLRGLGFSAVARPEERANLILFVLGGLTHTEVYQLQQVMRVWREREIAEEKANGGSGAIAAQRKLILGSTHIATGEDLTRQLLVKAATNLDQQE